MGSLCSKTPNKKEIKEYQRSDNVDGKFPQKFNQVNFKLNEQQLGLEQSGYSFAGQDATNFNHQQSTKTMEEIRINAEINTDSQLVAVAKAQNKKDANVNDLYLAIKQDEINQKIEQVESDRIEYTKEELELLNDAKTKQRFKTTIEKPIE